MPALGAIQQEIFSDGTQTIAEETLNATLAGALNLTNGTNTTTAASAEAPSTWASWILGKLLQCAIMGAMMFLFIIYNLWKSQESMLYIPQMPGATSVRPSHPRSLCAHPTYCPLLFLALVQLAPSLPSPSFSTLAGTASRGGQCPHILQLPSSPAVGLGQQGHPL